MMRRSGWQESRNIYTKRVSFRFSLNKNLFCLFIRPYTHFLSHSWKRDFFFFVYLFRKYWDEDQHIFIFRTQITFIFYQRRPGGNFFFIYHIYWYSYRFSIQCFLTKSTYLLLVYKYFIIFGNFPEFSFRYYFFFVYIFMCRLCFKFLITKTTKFL